MSNQLTSNQVAILWDGQNVHVRSEEQVIALLQFATKYGKPSYVKAYGGCIELKKWASIWDKCGFECRWVQASRLHKNDADEKIKADCKQYILTNPEICTVILLSKDGGFSDLVSQCQSHGKKVIIVTQSWNQTSKKLQKRVGVEGFCALNQVEHIFYRFKNKR
ncbi:NYN domain-containing protein [Laspinema olomoucense]|uniref:NYN domain-containing protein n=1 Tax=Laspinema olomoucense D3b TaxID=2953688 RepID=A0ABT2N9Y2_9CYAN|nr:NYN domain-containing protein [Laspinema sp. D3b]MCT7979503.1 NYN domain-containing protein [Laspinema sp. D3b]